MKTAIHHIHLNVSDAGKSLPFYKCLLGYLGYRIIDQSPAHIGTSNGTTDLWIVKAPASRLVCPFHRKNVGLNHIAFRVPTRKAVEKFTGDFLQKRGLKPLYGSPAIFRSTERVISPFISRTRTASSSKWFTFPNPRPSASPAVKRGKKDPPDPRLFPPPMTTSNY